MPKTLDAVFYANSAGREPARDWLRGLQKADKQEIGADIATVQYGWPLGMPLVRKIERGFWEVRTHLADGIARIFFTMHDDKIVILHGFMKKSAKTPNAELDIARKRKREVLNG